MKSYKPKVSIIMPSFNVRPYIKQCIESVIAQSLKEIEIICVDGGSTDGTIEILEEYTYIDSRIKLIQTDVGSYGYQMNLGINIANGEYIGIVETDDYIDEDMFESLYEATNNGTVDISKSSFYHLQENGETIDSSKPNLPKESFTIYEYPEIIKSHPSIWAAIYKKSFLIENNIQFIEAPGGGWVDNPFLVETALLAKNINYQHNAFYHYREFNPNSSSNKLTDLTLPMRRMLNLFDIFEKYNCNNKKILSTFYIRVFWHIQDLVNNHYFGDQKEEVLNYINQVIQKLDKTIVKKDFGINEQKLYYRYLSPLFNNKIDNNINSFTKEEITHLIDEHDFLYDSIEKSEGQIINNNMMEKRMKYASQKLLKNIKNINIAYVLHGFPIHSETFIVNEVRWLKENGYNIFIFIRNPPYKPIEIDFDVKISRYNSLFELEKLIIENEIDLMHTHFIYPICTNFTFPIAEKLKIPFTVFAHAYDIFVKENDKQNNIQEISKSDFCIGIFTLSQFHKNYLVKRNVEEEKIIITKQATEYNLKEINDKLGNIKNIISISRFVEKKGLDVLIKTAKILENENFKFTIYGFGDLENQLQRQIDELNCNNISIEGELHPNDVLTKIKECDLLASPCKIAKNGDMDGFPTIIFESMAAGVPIITTKVSAIPEIIIDGKNGFLVDPDNPEMFAKKIKEISKLTDSEIFEIVKNAQQDVKNISSVEKTMNKYIDTVQNWEI